MHTRPASLADLDALVPLFDGYRRFYGQASDPELARRFLDERLRLGDTVILLAEAEGTVVGFTHLFPIFSSTRCRRLWLLNDLFVEPAIRAHGAGRVLLAAARAHAEATGACGLELATAHSNLPAQRLYQAMGWTLDEEFRHYELRLD
jgi:GNAT superfamily N-acetyltransferase